MYFTNAKRDIYSAFPYKTVLRSHNNVIFTWNILLINFENKDI